MRDRKMQTIDLLPISIKHWSRKAKYRKRKSSLLWWFRVNTSLRPVHTVVQRPCLNVASDIALIKLFRFFYKLSEAPQKWVATPINQILCKHWRWCSKGIVHIEQKWSQKVILWISGFLIFLTSFIFYFVRNTSDLLESPMHWQNWKDSSLGNNVVLFSRIIYRKWILCKCAWIT